jgi:hypothetical protein
LRLSVSALANFPTPIGGGDWRLFSSERFGAVGRSFSEVRVPYEFRRTIAEVWKAKRHSVGRYLKNLHPSAGLDEDRLVAVLKSLYQILAR